jgi:6-pyruvoyltetrahydropterin/6-carboxytetrahydropterin synthase
MLLRTNKLHEKLLKIAGGSFQLVHDALKATEKHGQCDLKDVVDYITDRKKKENLMQITRKIEFDAGHRIPNHKSKCRNMHGHRYVLEATVEGNIKEADTISSDAGMVHDFSDLKEVMDAAITRPWDHGFLVWINDTDARKALENFSDHKTIILDCIPTAENLVSLAAKLISNGLHDVGSNLKLVKVRLYETPNNWADWNK